MDTESMIDVTDIPPIELVKAAYDYSRPQGLGFIHAQDGHLSDEDAQAILDREPAGSRIIASMDYVHGRACKFTIFRDSDTGKSFISDYWFDHSKSTLDAMLESVGIAAASLTPIPPPGNSGPVKTLG